MAAVRKDRNVNFTLEEVLNQDIVNNNAIERPANCLETVKEGLGALAEEKGFKNVAFFVEQSAHSSPH